MHTHPAPEGPRALVDSSAIRANLTRCAQWAGDADVMGVVKAGGYGHGALAAARAARAAGVAIVGVARPEEALALREAGVGGPVIAWLPTPATAFGPLVEHEVTVGVGSRWVLDRVVAAAREAGVRATVHLELDTGMSRGGVAPGDWQDVVAASRRAEQEGVLRVEGVFSHLACADDPGHPSVDVQRDAFEDGLAVVARAGLDPRWRHLANSAAVVTRPDLAYDLVRPGLSAYGLSPVPQLHTAADLGLRPAMTLTSPLSAVRRVPAGSGVSYSFTHVTATDRWLGVVPLGYGDGIPRAVSDAAPVQVRPGSAEGGSGSVLAARIAGRVCMDQFVVDLREATGAEPPAAVGDEVVLFGDGTDGGPTAQDWAEVAGTISYEVVTRLGPRVPRVLVGEDA